MQDVVYRARALGHRPWIIAWGLMLVATVVPAILVPIGPGLANFLLGIPVYAITWAIPVWIGLLTLWSINRYADITLTREQLRVGREKVAIQELDPPAVRSIPSDRPGALIRLKASASDVDAPYFRPAGGPVRQFGGSYGSTFGSDSVVLPLRTGPGLRIDVRDRDALLKALDDVLPAR